MILPSPINKWLNPELILLNNKNHKIQAPWCPSTLQTNFILLQAQPSWFSQSLCHTHKSGPLPWLWGLQTSHLHSNSTPGACCLLSQPSSCSSACTCCDFRLQLKTPLFGRAFLPSNSASRALLLLPGCQEHSLPHCAYLWLFYNCPFKHLHSLCSLAHCDCS